MPVFQNYSLFISVISKLFFKYYPPDSAASQAGFTIGSCVLKVGEKDMVTCKHDEVVAEVKKSLDTTARTAGGKRVSVKLSLPSMEHLAQFQYENIDSIALDVYERTVESPYVFSVPAQVLIHYVPPPKGGAPIIRLLICLQAVHLLIKQLLFPSVAEVVFSGARSFE